MSATERSKRKERICSDSPHAVFRVTAAISAVSCLLLSIGDARAGDAAQLIQFRNATYVSNQAVHDDETWVDGGADGSSLLMIRTGRNRDKTTWVLLSGNYLFLRVPGEPPEEITSKPGWGVTSYNGGWGKPFEVNHQRLSMQLQKLAKAHGVLHVPFLTGKGWPELSLADTRRGARASRARRLLQRMRLNMFTVGTPPPGDARVVEQSPAGGTPVSPGTTVFVRLEASTPSGVAGDTRSTAIVVSSLSAAEGEERGLDPVLLTDEYTNEGANPNPSCKGNGVDVFWRLPKDASKTRNITVRLDDQSASRLTLSAWKDDGTGTLVQCTSLRPPTAPTTSCNRRRRPEISYVDDQEDTFIVIDAKGTILQDRGPESLTLVISWKEH